MSLLTPRAMAIPEAAKYKGSYEKRNFSLVMTNKLWNLGRQQPVFKNGRFVKWDLPRRRTRHGWESSTPNIKLGLVAKGLYSNPRDDYEKNHLTQMESRQKLSLTKTDKDESNNQQNPPGEGSLLDSYNMIVGPQSGLDIPYRMGERWDIEKFKARITVQTLPCSPE
ncbi:hypothetical protein Tco_0462824 [Tanacetum coccineum]